MASPFAVPAGSAYYATKGQNAPAPKSGDLGSYARAILGFDITPGFNLTNPLKNQAPAAKKPSAPAKQKQLTSPIDTYSNSYVGSDYGGYSSPQAQQLAQQQKSILDQLGGRLNTIYGSAGEAARQSGLGIDSTLKGWGLQQRQAQRAIDQKGIQNESSRRAGTQDILGMINRGVTSGARVLGNKNAGNSSAVGEIARAYGDIGQREQSKVNNQYALGQQAIDQEQQGLREQQDLYRNSTYQNSKEQIVGGIVQSAQSQLAELDNALRGASLPDRIAIEGEKNKVRDIARGELQKYDALLNQELASAQAQNPDQIRSEATRLSQLGQAPAGQFDYSTEAPMDFQGQAPAGSSLPLFSFKRNQDRQNQLAPQVV